MDCVPPLSTLTQLFTGTSNGNIRLEDRTRRHDSVDLLTLGSGWTWSFLGPAAKDIRLRTACTTRDGRNGSISFQFDPESDDPTPFSPLPDARTVVIIFPLYSAEAARRLVHGYLSTRTHSEAKVDEKSLIDHPSATREVQTRFVLLGSTGVWHNSGPTVQFAPLAKNDIQAYPLLFPRLSSVDEQQKLFGSSSSSSSSPWVDRHSKVDLVPRAQAENALLALNNTNKNLCVSTAVLCLAGLWGNGRSPRRFVNALAPTKERLAQLKSVHLVHGSDVAQAILAVHQQWSKAAGSRWLLTNERVYDLWDLVGQWGNAGEEGRGHSPRGPQPRWVQELMEESQRKQQTDDGSSCIRGLPRTPDQLGFAMDGSDFWSTFRITPKVPWVD